MNIKKQGTDCLNQNSLTSFGSKGLKKVLGLREVTFIAIGFMIGGGIFVFTGIVLKITGQALPLAYGLAVIPVFISVMPLAVLGVTIPSTGANYKYPSRMVSPGLAFLGIWIYAFTAFFGQIPLYAISCGNYITIFSPNLSPQVFALVLVTIIFLVNLLGIRLAAQLQGLLVIILILALIYYSYKGMTVLQPKNFNAFFDKGSTNLLIGTALLTFTYFGANSIIELGGEIINPGKVIPKAFFISFTVVAILYVLVALATIGAVPMESLACSVEPVLDASKAMMTPAARSMFVICGALVALITTLNALFMVGTKSLLIVVEDGLLPAGLGRLNIRFGTPYILLAIIWVSSIIGILLNLPMKTLASYASLGGLIIFLPLMIAAIKLPNLYPEKYHSSAFKLNPFLLRFCAFTGIVMVLFFGTVVSIDLKTLGNIAGFFGFFISGVLYYVLRKQYLFKNKVDLNALIGKEDWDG